MGGYLATITSQGENDFILNNVLAGHLPQGGPAVFIGASDAAHEGVWQWVTGPDAGTTFWNGAVNGSAVSGQYANWQPGNPNNATINVDGSEDFAVMAGDGKWVDVPSVRDVFSTMGYIVEFSSPSSSTASTATIQNDCLAIARTALPLNQATTIANAINAGTQTETQYVNSLFSQVVNTTIPAVAVEATMYGATGTSAEITSLTTNFLPAQIANAIHMGTQPASLCV